eukprot:2537797-Rhodomonas_salina.1
MCCWQLTGEAVDKAPEDLELQVYNDIFRYFVTECFSKMASMQYLFDRGTARGCHPTAARAPRQSTAPTAAWTFSVASSLATGTSLSPMHSGTTACTRWLLSPSRA